MKTSRLSGLSGGPDGNLAGSVGVPLCIESSWAQARFTVWTPGPALLLLFQEPLGSAKYELQKNPDMEETWAHVRRKSWEVLGMRGPLPDFPLSKAILYLGAEQEGRTMAVPDMGASSTVYQPGFVITARELKWSL